MKTSKDLNRFKKEFVRWQNKLGLTCYRACFEQKNMPGDYAKIDVNEQGQVALISLCTEKDPDYGSPEQHAIHEALHLLTNRLVWLAQQRYVTEDEIGREWEAVVRRLEKVL